MPDIALEWVGVWLLFVGCALVIGRDWGLPAARAWVDPVKGTPESRTLNGAASPPASVTGQLGLISHPPQAPPVTGDGGETG